MVNEKFIIENKKPVETVYELKDEYKIPSFEEFNKTYKGGVNYADLNRKMISNIYLFSNISEILTHFKKIRYYIMLDLVSVY